MLNIEINGKAFTVPDGSTIMDAAESAGVYIPRFCYHRKLSIAANCRMCLVEVEGQRKPFPACVTPVTDQMKILTHSPHAVAAQKAVMEFLLINHPLDCPICDQGGECQLQDLAVGYGGGFSRYAEEKRVVFNKDFGPLIGGDMTRCIQCTRCVRFGQEIAGIMELGMANRGEHAEIVTFLGRHVSSELSGNVIDLCPVGALTSKPFRYTARTWELRSVPGVAPHDSLGSPIKWQVKQGKIFRVLPREDDSINECWLSDRDRFSYLGLAAEHRLTQPMIRRDDQWREVGWEEALQYAAQGLKDVRGRFGADMLGAFLSPHASSEELYLAQKLWRGLGSENLDSQLRALDPEWAKGMKGAPWLGSAIPDLGSRRAILLLGCGLRREQPLLAARIRHAVSVGAHLYRLGSSSEDLLCPVAKEVVVPPSELVAAAARLVKAFAEASGSTVSGHLAPLTDAVVVDDSAKAIVRGLMAEKSAVILLGAMAQHLPQASALHALGLEMARLAGAGFGVLPDAANTVGAFAAGAVPRQEGGGLAAGAMIAQPRKGYLLYGVEPAFDFADASATRAALGQAFVVACTPFKTGLEQADVLLPIAAPSEFAGSYINLAGTMQSFSAAVNPPGGARPGWKVLRVLGNLLDCAGFDYADVEEIRAELPSVSLDNGRNPERFSAAPAVSGLQRLGDVALYGLDPLVRRSPALAGADAEAGAAFAAPATLAQCGVADGEKVSLTQGEAKATATAKADASLPPGVVRVFGGTAVSAELGPLFGAIELRRTGDA